MKKFKCKECGKIYDVKPEVCECGSKEFEEEEIQENTNPKIEAKKGDALEVELLRKQIEQLNKQKEIDEENAKEKDKKVAELLKEKELQGKTEAEKIEIKRQTEMQSLLDQQQKVFEELDKMKKQNAELTAQNLEREFKNKKLMLINEHPYLREKIEGCEDAMALTYMFKFVDVDREKLLWEAENNASGSVLDVEGVIPKSKARKPLTIDEKLEERRQKRLAELDAKRNRRN